MQVTNARADLGRLRADLTLAQAAVTTRDTHDHAVQFYENDAYLVGIVAEFAADGLTAGQPVVIIASDDHADPLRRDLRGRDIDVDGHSASGLLTMLDARATLALFMDGDTPNPERFRATVGRVIERSAACGKQGGIRAYGELVDLLWRDGNGKGAVRLEELWNDLASTYEFSLLCAYAMVNFHEAEHATALQQICRTHTHVRPTERFTECDDGARLVEIALLQQRAQALETEVMRRQGLEDELRRAVAAAEHAKSVAEQANRAKSQFLAVMSHELRTPLNAIGGYAELLEMGFHGPVSDDQREWLDRIQRSQRHLLGLINQVLNYAKIETGSLRYDIADVMLDDALRLAETLVVPQIAAKGLRFKQTPNGSLAIRADREKFQQIVLNLVSNAAKFTDEGGEISITCTRNGPTVLVRVCDTGIGIPPEKLSAIFEPFVQVDTNYTRTKDGVGLGLAISRDLARSMHGDLTVESTLGQGSTFTLALPAASR